MAKTITRLYNEDGYGQIEPNQVTFTRDGRIEAQCALNATDFTNANPAENGMLLAVDKANNEIVLPTADTKLPIGLHYSTEHIYNQFTPGLKNFYMVPGEFYPRIGFLAIGERFTTNCLCAGIGADPDDAWATTTAADTALKAYATTPVYGVPSTIGAIELVTEATDTGILLQVVDYTTMADGQTALKFIVLRV